MITELDGNRIASESFAKVFQAYIECSNAVQGVIRDMVEIINADDATGDQKEAAVSILADALFPARHNGELEADLEVCEKHAKGEQRDAIDRMNAAELRFADKLKNLMQRRNMTQAALAQATGVGQSAISMMLNRNCRPQRRTLEKLATGLKVPLHKLWAN